MLVSFQARAICGFVLLVFAVAATQDPAHAAGCRDATPTSWDIVVAPRTERGERLVVTGHVISGAYAPLGGINVYVYHADADGNYTRSKDAKEPRLCGVLRTNEKGEYRFETSMPGGYEGYAPHIHFEVWGPKVKRQPLFVNLLLQSGPDPIPALEAKGIRPDRAALYAVQRSVYRDGKVLRCTKDLQVSVTP
jgi:protocatechuate 3,4-dioxygenase beta subunit